MISASTFKYTPQFAVKTQHHSISVPLKSSRIGPFQCSAVLRESWDNKVNTIFKFMTLDVYIDIIFLCTFFLRICTLKETSFESSRFSQPSQH